VAEGIENQAEFLLLRSLGCSIGQGYYFSPPLPMEQLLTFLATHRE
jgi:EAL domain-containing protein (putative c-di-GMP-specific phosphodiesterase class I)